LKLRLENGAGKDVSTSQSGVKTSRYIDPSFLFFKKFPSGAPKYWLPEDPGVLKNATPEEAVLIFEKGLDLWVESGRLPRAKFNERIQSEIDAGKFVWDWATGNHPVTGEELPLKDKVYSFQLRGRLIYEHELLKSMRTYSHYTITHPKSLTVPSGRPFEPDTIPRVNSTNLNKK